MTRHEHTDAGTQLVEMAILLPFLTLLALGAADFARVSHTAITLGNAARAGAQFGIQSPAAAQNVAAMRQAAENDADPMSITATATNFCRCAGSTTNVSCTPAMCAGVAKELYVRVTTSRTFQTLVPYPGVPSSVPMSREAVLRVR